ncbi:hypothetical protein [Spongiivirga citrea]|uniref:Uncharacterized protein n=1 Tax=Spongiivirga citrea TaxID=1481457 RepID=A0A6M0CRT6_9FLAO|nr:hypothetical protein [Spongiivirga citrea]NER18569.1 hypothetical protein [Spongiivirga citrea]
MLSTGQLIFAGLFVIVFTAVIIFSYRKDIKMHKSFFKGGVGPIIIGFLIFVGILLLIKFYVK